ncbi:sulfate ABC transporter substrate-binding protein [Asticcacaulis sp. AND118]|uniref:sulfate ABC transporter substrate-binding protein n=1 Tax=Asticcacaulis sp. AND118 TaxID=2840468 RepID=UPI001CFFC3E7|nr:sulfate ABC transporter substrate-binding protein [Asticcacaulis sp. AND118]UDF05396.1 sulfate ABC transporter substrate-binding protein [Asticcacaulis sp. AND118]
MTTPVLDRRHLLTGATALTLLSACTPAPAARKPALELLNVSYDPTRELYDEYNALFAKHWREKTGQEVVIRQSHGGSGKQARAVIDGLEADVVTLALSQDIDTIAGKSGLLPSDWQGRLPHQSSPYTSIIVFLVRKGNPKGIRDWGDLIKPGVEVITPNPKTGGGARWNYLAGYAWALKTYGDEAKADDYIQQLYAHVPVLDTGARGSTTTFVQRGLGDVLLTWENEAWLALKELGAEDAFEIVTPPTSILAEPPVAWLDKVVAKKGTVEVARAYLEYLYSPEAQDVIGRHHYRPVDPVAAAKYAVQFPGVALSTIRDLGGWTAVQARHFDDGGVFDRVTRK